MLRIDPAARPLWRSPTSVQFGLDPELARLDDVTAGVEHLLHALVVGTEPGALRRLAALRGVPERRVSELLTTLRPVLPAEPRPAPRAIRVLVDGPASLGAPLAARLDAERFDPERFEGGRLLDPSDALVVVAAHHVVAPERTVAWLARDAPHVAVVFGDQAVRVGPLVHPGRTPCLRCAEEHRLDDPARRALATQLLRRTTSLTAGSLPLALRAAARIAEAVRDLREGVPTGLEGAEERLGPDGSAVSSATPWHERCWCRGPAAPRPAQAGTGTASARPVAARPSAPTRS